MLLKTERPLFHCRISKLWLINQFYSPTVIPTATLQTLLSQPEFLWTIHKWSKTSHDLPLKAPRPRMVALVASLDSGPRLVEIVNTSWMLLKCAVAAMPGLTGRVDGQREVLHRDNPSSTTLQSAWKEMQNMVESSGRLKQQGDVSMEKMTRLQPSDQYHGNSTSGRKSSRESAAGNKSRRPLEEVPDFLCWEPATSTTLSPDGWLDPPDEADHPFFFFFLLPLQGQPTAA